MVIDPLNFSLGQLIIIYYDYYHVLHAQNRCIKLLKLLLDQDVIFYINLFFAYSPSDLSCMLDTPLTH